MSGPRRWPPDGAPSIGLRAAEAVVRPVVSLHGFLYSRGFLPSVDAGVPVISVGNLTVGGTGKTPCVIWLVRELVRRGERPVVLTRGYGRSGNGITVLDEGRGAGGPPPRGETGDEPLEIFEALHVPVVIGRDRAAAARLASDRFRPTCLVLDDGFQHRPIRRDFDLVLVDAASPFGNSHLIPAGPLREPATALGRADAVLLTRAADAPDLERSRQQVAALASSDARIGFADHVPVGLVPFAADRGERGAAAAGGGARHDGGFNSDATAPPAAGTPLFVVAGIARPAALASAAASLGYSVAGRLDFPDHHRYAERDLARVREAAGNRPIVTTAKDAVRWREVPGFDPAGWWVLRVEFRPRDPVALLARIAEVLQRAATRR